MKTKLTHLILALFLAPFTVMAQSEITSTSSGIDVIDSAGRHIFTLKPENNTNNDFSLSISGMQIGFKSPDKKGSGIDEFTIGGGGLEFGFEHIDGRPAVKFSAGINNKTASGKYRNTISTLNFGVIDLLSSDYSEYPASEHDFLDLHNSKSIHVSWYLVGAAARLTRCGTLGISSSVGLSWDNYSFSDNITLVRDNGMIHPMPLNRSYKKSKLKVTGLTVPVVLDLNAGKNISFSAGVYGTLVLKQHTKVKRPIDKDKGNHYVSPLQFGTTFRVHVKFINIFCNYSMTELFKSGKGPKVTPINFGIGFL